MVSRLPDSEMVATDVQRRVTEVFLPFQAEKKNPRRPPDSKPLLNRTEQFIDG